MFLYIEYKECINKPVKSGGVHGSLNSKTYYNERNVDNDV